MSKYALLFKGKRSKSRTQQHFKNEVNINTIMKKARRTGVLPVKDQDSYFQDLTGVTDYKSSMDRILEINQKFDALPAVIRNKFGNDPDQILKYLQNPENEGEARKLGLLRELTYEESKARADKSTAPYVTPTNKEPETPPVTPAP